MFNMPKILYVESIAENSLYGNTTDQRMIERNRMLLVPELKDHTGVLIFPAGRYICVVSEGKEADKKGMMFFDCRRNREIAEQVATFFYFESTRNSFIEVFEEVTSTYEENYTEVELEIDKSFSNYPAN